MCTAEAKLGAQQLRVDDDDAGREQQLRPWAAGGGVNEGGRV